MRFSRHVVLLACAAGWISGCAATDEAPPDLALETTGIVPIHAQVAGIDASTDGAVARLVTNRAELDAIGSRTLSRTDVDFAIQSVVVLTMGRCMTGGYWVRITAIEREGDRLIVYGIANAPGIDAMVTQAITYPFAAAVIDRTAAREVVMRVDSVRGREPPREPPGN